MILRVLNFIVFIVCTIGAINNSDMRYTVVLLLLALLNIFASFQPRSLAKVFKC